MLVHRHKKDTTPPSLGSTQEPAIPPLPDQQTFRQYLRELARGGIRVVVEDVMREELDALIGVGWGESSPKRKGYRNGFYSRDLATSSGRLEDLKVPRDREGHFHTQVFDRYSRYEPHIAEGLTQMFVAGTSTHKVGKSPRPSWELLPVPVRSVASTKVSATNLTRGESARCKRIGVSCTWMACISVFAMGTRPILRLS